MVSTTQYERQPTGRGATFGKILRYEIRVGRVTFAWLAEKREVSLPTLGELIWDHCKQLVDKI